MTLEDTVQTIDSADGWIFAFEGGAHVLFRYTKDAPQFQGKLLRLAKQNTHTLPTSTKYHALLDTFLPLLAPSGSNGDSLVVHTELVRVTYELLKRLQKEQVTSNTTRGSVLDLEEIHGTILEDLSADPSVVLLEFKPKWLAQSPTAPKNSNTCRTCALRRLRRKQPKANPRFCPLDLASGKQERIYRAVTALLSEQAIRNTLLASLITDYLLSSPLIPLLLKAQTCPDSSLATKMTLRDCTLFVLVPRHLISDPKAVFKCSSPGNGIANAPRQELSCPCNSMVESFSGSGKIRVLVADLDEKSEKHRGEYWRSLEEQLISGGYYFGKGKLNPNVENCDLSDNISTSDEIKWHGFTAGGYVVDAYSGVSGNGVPGNGASHGFVGKRMSCGHTGDNGSSIGTASSRPVDVTAINGNGIVAT